jgi:hypothetical protein
MLSDIDALNIHLAAVAKDLGLTASARLIAANASDISSGGSRVEVVVADPATASARKCRKSVTAAYYQNAGIHTFDEFIRTEAARELKAR